MKRIFQIGFLLFGFSHLSAQTKLSGSEMVTKMSLKECIETALAKNPSIKQSQLSFENQNVLLLQSKTLKLPTLNGFTNLNGNAGRNVDPFTNSVVTSTIATNNLGVQASIDLFDGSQNKNTVERNKLNLEASLLDLSAQKNNISLQVAVAYLNVLAAEDQIEVSKKQAENTDIQIARTQKLVKSGAVPETNLYDLEAQQANDDLSVVNAQNNLEAALLTLKQAMSITEDIDIKLTRVDLPNIEIGKYEANTESVFQTSIGFLPEVKAGEVRKLAADKNMAIAKSLGLPTVSLSSSWGTAFSSVAKKLTPTGTTANPVAVSAEFQGQTIPFVINLPQQNFSSDGIPYFSQLGNNQNLNVGLNVRIPIFNGYNAKYQVQSAKIQKLQTEVQNESTKLQIRQNIDQAFINMNNAQKRYTATQAQVTALEKSFKASESRFNAGSGTFVDYNLARTNLDRAKTSLIISKYDYFFRVKILDFYQNKPLAF